MIEYQFKEEKDFATYYAKELDRPIVLSMLSRDFVETEEETKALSVFFWDIVINLLKMKSKDPHQNGMRVVNFRQRSYFKH